MQVAAPGGASPARSHRLSDFPGRAASGVGELLVALFDPIGVGQDANCPNSNSTFTYDARGLLKTKTDNKGHLTTYEYNDRGLEVSRTEAAGTPQARTITTQWHPTLFLKTQITEPERVIRYHYDEQGRQIGQTVTPL